MKLYLVAFVLLALDPIGKLDRVAKQNALKKEAKAAFMNEDYKTAIEKYSYLHDSLNVRDDNILLNLATAQYKVADSASALSNYQKLTSSAHKNVQSIAYQQLGVMNNTPQKQQEALDYFKKALKADPTNEAARYNYELLKKLMKEQENQQDKQNKDDKNKDQQDKKEQEKQEQEKDEKEQQEKEQQEQEKGDKQDQEQKDQQQKDQQQKDQEQQEQSQEQQDTDEKKDKEQKEGQTEQEQSEGKKDEKEEIPPSTYKKLQEMKISPEKAKMILEAMKNQEVQYIQQNKKKARTRAKNDKPDW